jgi:hypothetical protein
MKLPSLPDPSLKSNREAPKSSLVLGIIIIIIIIIIVVFSSPTSSPHQHRAGCTRKARGDGPSRGFLHAWSATLIALLSSSIDFWPEVVISS